MRTPSKYSAGIFLAAVVLAAMASAQDPFVVAPRAYKIAFENEWVRVIRVHYAPLEKIAAHDHPKRQVIFVYLNDGGPVRFKHVEGYSGSFPSTRPATTAGAFRLAAMQGENHEVENLSSVPSDFLQIELKTEVMDLKSFQGKYLPEPSSSQQLADSRKIEFENGQIRVTRLICKSTEGCSPLEITQPALLIALSSVEMRRDGKGGKPELKLAAGQTKWLATNDRFRAAGSPSTGSQQLVIEFKTKPAPQRS